MSAHHLQNARLRLNAQLSLGAACLMNIFYARLRIATNDRGIETPVQFRANDSGQIKGVRHKVTKTVTHLNGRHSTPELALSPPSP